MLTRPEASDPALEELKRRGRRRLVGAIVLMLGAAVVLPLLLESDPKPLGEDVSIQIPPIDSGKFITPLSPAKGTSGKATPGFAPPSSAPPGSGPAVAPPAAVAPDSVPAPAAPASTTTVSDAKAGGADTGKPAEAAPRAHGEASPPAAPKATSMITPVPDAQKPPAEVPRAAPKAAPAETRALDAPAPVPGFVVQLAALADSKAAAALVSKLKSAGFPAYLETLKTRQGTMRRVRVGPYPAREVADAQQVKLSAAGYRGVVTTK